MTDRMWIHPEIAALLSGRRRKAWLRFFGSLGVTMLALGVAYYLLPTFAGGAIAMFLGCWFDNFMRDA